jgi:transposase
VGRGKKEENKICLSAQQRERLADISRNGHAPAKKILHAQVLLMADEGAGATKHWTDEEIAAALNLHRNTVQRIRYRFLAQGEQPALNRRVRATPPVAPMVDGHLEAQIVALCCSQAPDGRTCWTLELLTHQLKARQIVLQISRETVRRTLKKTSYALGK